VLAVLLAWFFSHVAMQFEVGGEIFLRLLLMVVVPVAAFSVMSGILGLGDVSLENPPVLKRSKHILHSGEANRNSKRPAKAYDNTERRLPMYRV
jgi:hypothetical protein